MIYLLVDTCVLADIMRQYNPLSQYSELSEKVYLKKNMLRMINSVISDKDGQTGIIVTSTFAFLELINKYDKIFELEIEERKISLARIIATIKQPPSWLVIDDMDIDTAKNFCNVPNSIESGEHISSDDAVHIATALQRGYDVYLLTSDHVLKALRINHITVIAD